MADRKEITPAAQCRLDTCHTIGRLLELWGFRKSLGCIWTLLYLNGEPMSAVDIAEHLSISRGSISMSLQELLRWGVVRKSWKHGERRDFFEAEEDIARIALRVLNEREVPAIDEAVEGLAAASEKLGEIAAGKTGLSPEEETQRRRTDNLVRMAKRGRSLFKTVVGPRGAAAALLKQLYPRRERKK